MRWQSSCSSSSDLSCACLSVRSCSLCVFAGRSGGLQQKLLKQRRLPRARGRKSTNNKRRPSGDVQPCVRDMQQLCFTSGTLKIKCVSDSARARGGGGCDVCLLFMIVFYFVLFLFVVIFLPQRSTCSATLHCKHWSMCRVYLLTQRLFPTINSDFKSHIESFLFILSRFRSWCHSS